MMQDVAKTITAAIILTACATARSGSRAAPEPVGQMGEAAAMARARADSARKPYTAADIAFMSHMISHHAQAIAMANWAPSHNASASVQRLSARIINAQTDEIRLMQMWLRDRRQTVPEPDPAGMKMMMGGQEHVMLMPGMLTPEQMRQLDAARGQEFDRVFLTFMIQHHRGAVSMVKELFSSWGAGQDDMVFKFASDVNVDQSTEIDRMLQMLLQLGSPAPTP
jgi:uncharacterized protein (DUF305 family)